MVDLASRLASLSPFGRKQQLDTDDSGELVDSGSIAGGGHAGRHTELQDSLRVSEALRRFLAHEKVIRDDKPDSPTLSPTLHALLQRPHIQVPPELTDRSHPLSAYFFSSSHNTYLKAHQLFGASEVSAYGSTLAAGARCVEIDAWDDEANADEPKVTHGYTLVSHISFRAVCEAIRDVVDKEAQSAASTQSGAAAPIFISLENHCNPHGQKRLVNIMQEVWGDRLLSSDVRRKGHEEQEGGAKVRLDELGSKIVVIAEYYFPGETVPDDDDDDDDEGSDGDSGEQEDTKKARAEYAKKKKATTTTVIIPELADIGVCAQSCKPPNNSWFESELVDGPHDHLINVSESALSTLLSPHKDMIAAHNANWLMRVYPKGTRISSKNLDPVPFWGIGAQICALNWQSFGPSMQLNEALFSGTDGFVLKPSYLRGGEKLPSKRKRLRLRIAGATDVPVPKGRESDDIKPYVSCVLIHPDDLSGKPPKCKTDHYKQAHIPFLRPGHKSPVTDPLWDETLEWVYADDELVFLRMLLKSDDKFAANPTLATAAVRLHYAVKGWNFIRLIDPRGHETTCTLLVKVDIDDA
ncbi:uncharacterized protein EHS24_003916 [Apiotrichum porosum]|uniref:Phosphoinositide phospholipase C n=1 Tax=Apiotrichum porosum TaxID=105984 RepID=A0A427XE16_9TREE|nr:uncharacterized protein EHS24_003916 [Apiotrichum porosum]RSH76977.1 hypothetical protein EHS24_003916 [Apiotrichum porosum]